MEDRTCFVIGPIGDKYGEPGSEGRETWEQAVEIFEEVIQLACSAFGLRPLRADQISQPGEIPEQIFRHLRDDDVVIADLTGANANVMYELGLRHTTGRLTIQLGEVGRLPFDVAAIRTIRFKRTAAGLIEARKELSAALAFGLESGALPVAATRVWLENSANLTLPILDHAVQDEPGFLEKVADMAEGVGRIPQEMNSFTEIMKEIGGLVQTAAERVERINAAKGSPGAKVEIANRLAEQLQGLGDRLESNVGEFRRSVEQTDPGVRVLLREGGHNELASEEERAEAQALREAVKIASSSVADFLPKAESLRETMLVSGDATRSLRKANTRLSAAIGDFAEAARRVVEWGDLV